MLGVFLAVDVSLPREDKWFPLDKLLSQEQSRSKLSEDNLAN